MRKDTLNIPRLGIRIAGVGRMPEQNRRSQTVQADFSK
jgi:hypothetical protein